MPPDGNQYDFSDQDLPVCEITEVRTCEAIDSQNVELQSEATDDSTKRKRFLENSLGKNHSPSTEVLINIVPEIFDGDHLILGLEKPKPQDHLVQAAAEAIHEACAGPGSDPDAIFAALAHKSDEERRDIEKSYEDKFGSKLTDVLCGEMKGAQLDHALNLLRREDGQANRARRVHETLLELDQLIEGRSDSTCEKDIRDTLAVMNSKEIAELKADYLQIYGDDLSELVRDSSLLSEPTKSAIAIYLKGTDGRNKASDGNLDSRYADTMQLAELALEAENIEMLQEAFRGAPEEATKLFLASGGAKKVIDAFWGSDEVRALDYASFGKLELSTLLDSNQSLLGDNESAISVVLARAGVVDKERYVQGRKIELSGGDPESLSAADREKLDFYQRTRKSLDDAGHDTEVAAWEAILLHGEDSLIVKLAAHCGSIYDDDLNTIISSIENMKQSDWETLKGGSGESFKTEIRKALTTFLDDDDVARCMSIVERKASYDNFADAAAQGKRDLEVVIADSAGTVDDDEESIYQAISDLSATHKERYQSDEDFRRRVDLALSNTLDEGPELEAARAMLKFGLHRSDPADDIVAKLNRHAADTNTDELNAAKDLVAAFQKDPALLESIRNPVTDRDREYAQAFRDAAGKAFDDEEFDNYVEPFLQNGTLPLATKLNLNWQFFDDDETGLFNELAGVSAMERDLLLSNKPYKDELLHFLDDDEMQIADHIMVQKAVHAEDRLRAHILGVGDEKEMPAQLLKQLSNSEKQLLRERYAEKYQSDLATDLVKNLDGQDSIDAVREIAARSDSANENLDRVRDEVYLSRDGIGKYLVDSFWDGTGHLTDEALNSFIASVAEQSEKFQQMPQEEQKLLIEDVRQQLDLFRASKKDLSDTIADVAITLGTLGGGLLAEGTRLAIIKAMVAGGVFKAGSAALVQGSDYDDASVLEDFLSGAIASGIDFIGATGVFDRWLFGKVASELKAPASDLLRLKQSFVDLAERANATVIEAGDIVDVEDVGQVVRVVNGGRASLQEGTKAIVSEGGSALLNRRAEALVINGGRAMAAHGSKVTVMENADATVVQGSIATVLNRGRADVQNGGFALVEAGGSVRIGREGKAEIFDGGEGLAFKGGKVLVHKGGFAEVTMHGEAITLEGATVQVHHFGKVLLSPGVNVRVFEGGIVESLPGTQFAIREGQVVMVTPQGDLVGKVGIEALSGDLWNNAPVELSEIVGKRAFMVREGAISDYGGKSSPLKLVTRNQNAVIQESQSCTVFDGGFARVLANAVVDVEAGGRADVLAGGTAFVHGGRAQVLAGGYAQVHNAGELVIRKGGRADVMASGRAYLDEGAEVKVESFLSELFDASGKKLSTNGVFGYERVFRLENGRLVQVGKE